MKTIKAMAAAYLLGFSMLAQPALAVDPVKGNPTRQEVQADMNRPNAVRPGLGDDEGSPQMTPFQIPAGVRIAGEAVGADMDGQCPGDTGGRGEASRNVQICLPVCTIGNQAVTITFPPGLIVTTGTDNFQNGLLVTREVVTVPPAPCNSGPGVPVKKKKRTLTAEENGGEEGTEEVEIPSWDEASLPGSKVYWVKLSTFCLNESKDPSSVEGRYTIGGITADPDLLDLATFLSKRDLSDPENNQTVQKAVYSVTEGKGLTWQDRKDLYEIPAL